MLKQQALSLRAAILSAGLVLTACQTTPSPSASLASSPTPSQIARPSVDFLACEVSDSGGMNDNGFNQSAYDGLKRAESELGIQIKFLESSSDADYAPNINTFISDGCDIIVTVGFLLGQATQAAAEANPDQTFAIVDYAFEPPMANVLGLVFDTKSASMLQGYLAAGMSQSGTIATFGGIQIGLVTDSMDGFVAGAKYYNEQKGAAVTVLGWDPAIATGTFTNDFSDETLGHTTAAALLGEDADVIYVASGPYPGGGPMALGAMAAALEAGNALFIGADVDQYVAAPDYKSILVSGTLKRIDTAVFEAIMQAMAGPFPTSVYVGTLANDGVGRAPFHDLESRVPQSLQDELSALKTALIDGSVKPEDYQ